MHITIFGASGGVGRLLVELLLQRGHTVTVFVHRHSPFEATERLRIARGDIHDARHVAAAIAGSDAIGSTLSSWGTPRKDVLSAAMTNICPAMQSAGISRIVSLTGADARGHGDRLTLLHRLFHRVLRIIAGTVLDDGEKHMEILRMSGLHATVVRSPIMFSRADSAYVLNDIRPLPWAMVNRAAVARAMADCLEGVGNADDRPFIHRP
jgi:NAD(P)-dependent dehydrogenase (short-subunit alcohol dehydrogenase family)